MNVSLLVVLLIDDLLFYSSSSLSIFVNLRHFVVFHLKGRERRLALLCDPMKCSLKSSLWDILKDVFLKKYFT